MNGPLAYANSVAVSSQAEVAVELAAPPGRWRGEAYAAFAAVTWSSAGILQRQLSVSVPTQVGTRALFAFLALGCFVVVSERGPGQLLLRLRTSMVPTVAVAICVAAASATFVVALSRTTVAHVLLFQALAPLIAAGVGVRFLNEPVSRSFWLAMALSIVGVVVMVGGPGGGSVTGDGLALLSTCAFAAVVLLARRHQAVSMAPAACLAQLLLVLVMAPFANPSTIPASNFVWLFLLGAGQLGLGLAAFTAAAQLVPAARLTIIVLLEIVLGPLWVWIGVGERPSSATLLGGALVLTGVVVQVMVGRDRPNTPTCDPG